ncbi:GNAT family N-acetyltransferase [Mycobacteroides salmoniphilum]|uniref:GNAT family N-acetyltransferase n=1 Tax=Mycobacteroides salmoniphilum TaxID=404941 RepID=UPI001F38ED1B|nr:GNAT family N-acetyltransferase [Mycobacteroides salmoniphilum]
MLARLHEDLAEYWALAGPLYSADPVLHTVELHVGARLRRTASDPAVALITLTDLGHLAGAAMVTGQGLVRNAIPMAGVTATVSLLAKAAIRLPAVSGAPVVTRAVADTWVSMTGAAISDTTDERLYRLDHFQPRRLLPTGGCLPALGTRRRARCHGRSAGTDRRGIADRSGVHRGPAHRGRGYGSAVTAAACEWARQAGAQEIVLTTDLANPTSNSIYRKLGFRAVVDSVIVEFAAPTALRAP